MPTNKNNTIAARDISSILLSFLLNILFETRLTTIAITA